ncbi:glycosyltransferase family 4 protein [Streptomyces sp. AJS327]|uniref:glycosyltransferase family 4 protein n=1 Tax=Streptomyces sp. AJS327 TaxID=2545265 RepID=UPI0027E3F966|nr:glycosyltransferase family 4 protein [Streptomyces sp. AJS327]
MSPTPPPHGPLLGRAPLRVVQVLGGASPASGGVSSTRTAAHVRSLTEGLVARGVRVTVCAGPGAESRYGFTGAGARFAAVPAQGGPEAVAALRAVCAGADLVHAHGLRSGMLAALALSALRGSVRLVVTWHNRDYGEGARGPLVRLLERRVARAAEVMLGATAELVDSARACGARDARLAPVGLPHPERCASAGRPPGPVTDEPLHAQLDAVRRPLLFTAGRLDRHHGLGTLLTAARAWRHLTPEPVLAIAGAGPARPALQRRIEQEALPARLVGPPGDAIDLLARADVALLPARHQARSPLAQEALRAGVPLVACAVGGVPELVGDGALLVPKDDPDALAGAVSGLLRSPERGERLIAAGRAQAASWATEADTVAHVLSVYDEMTGAH